MKIVRAARLVLLTSSLAGLGVPAGFGQTTTASGGKAAPAKSAPKKKSAASSSSQSHNVSSTTTKKSSSNSSGKSSTAAKRGSAKSSSSKRARKQPGQKAPTADRVSEIQAALGRDGSFTGSPSGKWDDDTAAAMRRFQASHGLSPTGKLDAPTLQRLGLGSQTAGVAAPTPPPGATSRLTSSANVAAGPLESSHRQ
jgi:peptidoglycan hydrolase-like protein with peptidoglycan-binding domain